MVKSSYSFRHFYVNYLFLVCICLFPIYGLTHPGQMITIKQGVGENGLIICYVLLGLACFSLFFLLRNSLIVMVWPDRLVLRRLFSRSVIPKEAIISIELMAREKSSPGLNQFVDAVIIEQTGGRIRIRVDAYSNAAEIKRAIQRYLMPGQPAAAPEATMPPATIANQSPAKYSRSWLTSNCGWMLCGLTIMSWLFFLAIVSGPLSLRIGLPAVLTLAVYFGGGNLLYYFRIDHQELRVVNHFFPWVDFRFKLVDLQSAVIENRPAATIGLRVTMTNFECRTFIAESLRKPEWKALAERLGENGIVVIDEAY